MLGTYGNDFYVLNLDNENHLDLLIKVLISKFDINSASNYEQEVQNAYCDNACKRILDLIAKDQGQVSICTWMTTAAIPGGPCTRFSSRALFMYCMPFRRKQRKASPHRKRTSR